jgi:hypothetical protein
MKIVPNPEMNKYAAENHLVRGIRERFPAEAKLTDQWLVERGWDPTEPDGIAFTWVEAFADRTTEAIKRKDVAGVQAQTGYLAEQYRAAPEALRAIVDVSYAENIMWDASNVEKAWAWEFIAHEIRQLYEEAWGNATD